MATCSPSCFRVLLSLARTTEARRWQAAPIQREAANIENSTTASPVITCGAIQTNSGKHRDELRLAFEVGSGPCRACKLHWALPAAVQNSRFHQLASSTLKIDCLSMMVFSLPRHHSPNRRMNQGLHHLGQNRIPHQHGGQIQLIQQAKRDKPERVRQGQNRQPGSPSTMIKEVRMSGQLARLWMNGILLVGMTWMINV